MTPSFGIANLWALGDFVTRSVAVILILMSVASWYVIFYKAWRLAVVRGMARVASSDFWHAHSFDEGVNLLAKHKRNPFLALAAEGAEAAAHHANNREDLHGALNVSDWITSCLRRSVDESSAQLHAGLSVLASVGSTAPFIGLFGTVWGIYHALISIAAAGQASIDQVAGPVGEALIMTALGLAVAIPAVLAYNALVRGNKAVLAQLNHFAHDMHAYLVTGGRVNKRGAAIKLPAAVGV